MQNRYVGDVGDFGKYGLLRFLVSNSASDSAAPLKLGVNWYLFPDESHNDDGKHITYLNATLRNRLVFRSCDPQLYDALQLAAQANSRNVTVVRESGALPFGTVFHEAPLCYSEFVKGQASRAARRQQWLRAALEATADCDVVFVDPDNGLECQVSRYANKGPKYVYYDDLRQYAARGQSLVVYHHLSRQGSAQEQVARGVNSLKTELGLTKVHSLLYHRGTARVFFLLPQLKHQAAIDSAINQFKDSLWVKQKHFELI